MQHSISHAGEHQVGILARGNRGPSAAATACCPRLAPARTTPACTVPARPSAPAPSTVRNCILPCRDECRQARKSVAPGERAGQPDWSSTTLARTDSATNAVQSRPRHSLSSCSQRSSSGGCHHQNASGARCSNAHGHARCAPGAAGTNLHEGATCQGHTQAGRVREHGVCRG